MWSDDEDGYDKAIEVTEYSTSTLPAGKKSRIRLSGTGFHKGLRLWFYSHGQPVLKATVISLKRKGGGQEMIAEVDLIGWTGDVSLFAALGDPSTNKGVWAFQYESVKLIVT